MIPLTVSLPELTHLTSEFGDFLCVGIRWFLHRIKHVSLFANSGFQVSVVFFNFQFQVQLYWSRMLCYLCPIAVIFFSISVRRNSRELFLVSMFVSFEFMIILVSSEYIKKNCINVISLSLRSFVTLSIRLRLPVRRLAVTEKDILAQYTYSIKHRMMSRRSALIFLKHVDRCPYLAKFAVHVTHYTHSTRYTCEFCSVVAQVYTKPNWN